jgi:hypothetical protein
MKSVLGKAAVAVVGGLIALGTAAPAYADNDTSVGQAFGSVSSHKGHGGGGLVYSNWAVADDAYVKKFAAAFHDGKTKGFGGYEVVGVD